jgi:ABC-type multidrug transport system ATPase subunit
MARFYFEVEDEEIIKFVKALKRKRSAVITQLIYQLMEESDEYLPSWLIVETGCTSKVGQKKDIPKTLSQRTVPQEKKEEEPKTDNASIALAGLSCFGF